MADKPKRKGLMSLLTEYQNENNKSGLTKDGDSKSDIAEARRRQAKVKAQAAAKKKAGPKKKSEAKKPVAQKTTPKTNTPPKATTTPKNDRVSKFLGGQTVQQMADKRKTKTDKEKAATDNKQKRGLLNKQGQTLAQQRAARQAELNKRLKKKREEEKRRRQKSGSNWAKGQLKGL